MRRWSHRSVIDMDIAEVTERATAGAGDADAASEVIAVRGRTRTERFLASKSTSLSAPLWPFSRVMLIRYLKGGTTRSRILTQNDSNLYTRNLNNLAWEQS